MMGYLKRKMEKQIQEEFTAEWFRNPENQVSEKDLKVGDHFLLDLYPVYGNGENRGSTDVEIWEVSVTKKKHYHKIRRQWFNFEAIRKVTTGKQFGYPNGYWKVKQKGGLNSSTD